jgi:hypothetical protein
VGVDEVGRVGLIHDSSRDDLLQEFAQALEEGNRPVSFWSRVIWAGGLGKDDHLGLLPRVSALGKAEVEEMHKGIRAGAPRLLLNRHWLCKIRSSTLIYVRLERFSW